MHKQGVTSWFSDGREERETILKIGEPWNGLHVIEIGCGEGDLGVMLFEKVKQYMGVDYSKEAIKKAWHKHGLYPACIQLDYRKLAGKADRIVMQGVLEHLDDPFGELQWMIEHFNPRTVITSSPCFLNPRGIVWMTLDMLGAVMSKTDLHYLNPWQFETFCEQYGYKLTIQDCDFSWGNNGDMIQDLSQRIPKALRDGNLQANKGKVLKMLNWLSEWVAAECGATMVYRIDL